MQIHQCRLYRLRGPDGTKLYTLQREFIIFITVEIAINLQSIIKHAHQFYIFVIKSTFEVQMNSMSSECLKVSKRTKPEHFHQ